MIVLNRQLMSLRAVHTHRERSTHELTTILTHDLTVVTDVHSFKINICYSAQQLKNKLVLTDLYLLTLICLFIYIHKYRCLNPDKTEVLVMGTPQM